MRLQLLVKLLVTLQLAVHVFFMILFGFFYNEKLFETFYFWNDNNKCKLYKDIKDQVNKL